MYSSLAIMNFTLKRQDEPAKKDAVAKKIEELVQQFPENERLALYFNNANFAEKMSAVIRETATQMFTKAITEANAEKQQEYYSRAYALVTDSVIWDEIAMDLSTQVEEMESEDEA